MSRTGSENYNCRSIVKVAVNHSNYELDNPVVFNDEGRTSAVNLRNVLEATGLSSLITGVITGDKRI